MDLNSFIIGYQQGKAGISLGSGVNLNLAYGSEPPDDTSVLWVKTEKPDSSKMVPSFDYEKYSRLSVSLPTSLTHMAYATVNTKVYMFGGSISSSQAYSNTIAVFDMATEQAAKLDTVLDVSVNGMAATAVGTKIYLFGGYDGSKSLPYIYMFDTETDEIVRLTTQLPTATYCMSAATVGTKIYLFGGYPHASVGLQVLEFDTETEQITTVIKKLPSATSNSIVNGYVGVASVVKGTKVYNFGAYSGTKINVFDAETKEMKTLDTPLPRALNHMAAAAVGNKIYLFGGRTCTTNIYFTNQIMMFDTETEQVVTLSQKMPHYIYDMAAASFGLNVYWLGGRYSSAESGAGIYWSNYIYKFKTTEPLPDNHLALSAHLTNNVFDLLPNVKIGVTGVFKGNASNAGEPVEAALYKDGEWKPI